MAGLLCPFHDILTVGLVTVAQTYLFVIKAIDNFNTSIHPAVERKDMARLALPPIADTDKETAARSGSKGRPQEVGRAFLAVPARPR